MNVPLFTWTPSYEPKASYKPKLLGASFGDGYAQTIPDGINFKPVTYTLTWSNEYQDVADAILAFLDERGGWQPFFWIEPTGRYLRLFKCTEYDQSQTGPGLFTVTATFVQAFDVVEIPSIAGVINTNIIMVS